MKQSAQSFNVKLRQEEETPTKISRLINSIYYFIEFVFIMAENEGYRLVAIHQEELLTNQTYKSDKGAKIAFLKLWNYRAWEEGVKPKWSHFYPPDAKWLKNKLEKIEKSQGHS